MKREKLSQTRFPIEYRLLITPRFDERQKKTFTFVEMHTVTEFTNFLYEIIVEDSVENDNLHLKIHGLRAPKMSFPGTGPATFKKDFSNLTGRYTITITKLDRDENVFVVNISEQEVTLERSPKDKFIEIVTRFEEL
jgi:hypothetical protein